MSKGSMAMVAAKATLFLKNNQEETARSVGVSRPMIAKAATVIEHAPELVNSVIAGVRG